MEVSWPGQAGYVRMRSEPARLGGISPDFDGIPPRRAENFLYKYVQVGQPSKMG